jgi:hypothetical protein
MRDNSEPPPLPPSHQKPSPQPSNKRFVLAVVAICAAILLGAMIIADALHPSGHSRAPANMTPAELHRYYWERYHAVSKEEQYKDPVNYRVRAILRTYSEFTQDQLNTLRQLNKQGGYDEYGKYWASGSRK